jgi:membrane-associated phospholipid phosphatase
MARIVLLLALLPCVLRAQCDDLPWEAQLVRTLNQIDAPAVRTTSYIVSDALMPLAIGTPVAFYIGGWIADDPQPQETAVQLVATLGVTYGVTYALKAIVDRDRPYQAYPDCITNYRNDSEGSFPSGHSSGAAALATTLSLRYPYWYVIAPSVTYALLTGFSRMNLGMHYLGDVLAGYAIGVGVAFAMDAVNETLFRWTDGLIVEPNTSASTFRPLHTPLLAISFGL